MAYLKEQGRKRRYSEDEEMGDAPPTRTFTIKQQQQQRDDWKRNKTGLIKKTPLKLKLAAMDKEKLLQVLASLLEKQPELKHDIMTYIPAPTIPSAIAVLNDKEKKLHGSFPYNKAGPRLDQYTFSRVKEPLLDLIDTITQYSHHFVSATIFPTVCFTYLDQVTHFAHRLPIWGMDQHNQPRLDLYKDLTLFWIQAIQTTSSKLSQDATFNTIGLWARNLAHHNTLANGLLDDAIYEFNQRLLLPTATTATITLTPFHPYDSPTSTTILPPGACHHPSPVTSLDTISPSPVVGYADIRR
ncbi:Cut8 six-helix bundle-domain-containing protein [Chlamydoabsidia padenii]|nr:Cut8 six-helix bundle-domain-containing protein [Chlamydoabsidia padenii]